MDDAETPRALGRPGVVDPDPLDFEEAAGGAVELGHRPAVVDDRRDLALAGVASILFGGLILLFPAAGALSLVTGVPAMAGLLFVFTRIGLFGSENYPTTTRSSWARKHRCSPRARLRS